MSFSKFDVGFTQKALAKAGIGVTMSFGLDGPQDVSSEDPDRVWAGEQRLEDGLAIARDLGATHVCGILYSAFQNYAVAPTATGVANAVDVVRPVGEKAASSGIVLGMEVVNHYQSNVLNTASQAFAFVRGVGLENVKFHLDCYRMNIEESDVAAAIRQTGSDLGYFYTRDSHRGCLGSGSIAFPLIFRALAEIDYQGPITFKSFSSKVVGQPLEGILGISRNRWEDSRDLATHAKAFTDVHLKSAREALANKERGTLP